MEKIKLVEASVEYLEEIEAYRQELLALQCIDACRSLTRADSGEEWLAEVENRRMSPTMTQHILAIRERDGKIIGMLQLHHRLTEWMLNYAGNIGCSVHPLERGKGYGREMLGQLLLYCQLLGMEKVLLCCREDNIASRKMILSCGGVYENTLTVPENGERHERYWIGLKNEK